MLGNAVETAFDVAALTVHASTIGILVFNEVMIEDFAMILGAWVVGGIASHFTPTLSIGFHRIITLQPIDDVEVVDMLFANVVTAKPIEIIPVAHLVLKFGLIRLPRASPNSATIPKSAHVQDIADGSILETLNGFHIIGLMAALETNGDEQVLFLGDFVGGKHLANAGTIHPNGLFHENVKPVVHGMLEMQGAKARRGGYSHEIDAMGHHFLVSVESSEHGTFIDQHLFAILLF